MKPAQTIAPADRATLDSIKDNFGGKSLEDQFSEFKREMRSSMRGMETRIRQGQDQICYLTEQVQLMVNLLTAIEAGVRTSPARRDAMAGYVSDCGKGADDAL